MEIQIPTEELKKDFYTKQEVDDLLQEMYTNILDMIKGVQISFKGSRGHRRVCVEQLATVETEACPQPRAAASIAPQVDEIIDTSCVTNNLQSDDTIQYAEALPKIGPSTKHVSYDYIDISNLSI